MPLPGTLAITDYRWYEYLSQHPQWEEVNFWTPSAHWEFRAPEFSPFLFKLKSPHNAIAGFGYFARYSALPDWLAWDCFGEGNGCSNLEEMKNRILAIRRRFDFKSESKVAQIGCIIVVNATFFPKDQWIPQPRDWPVRTLRPTRYDLEQGEGKRVWDECLHTSVQSPAITGTAKNVQEASTRYGKALSIRPRLGQGAFRVVVTEAYHRACAITQEHSLPALEAAHIRPFAQEGPHDICNGLLLRADFHRLFEQGYITVTTDYKLNVSPKLRNDFSNGRSYYPLHGTKLVTPTSVAEQPAKEFLEWHNTNVFLG